MDAVKKDSLLNHEIIKLIKGWVIPVGIALIISLLIKFFVGFPAYIPSTSMYPTLKVGDRVLVSKIYNFNNITRGDIIVFKSTELDDVLIKRVIGLPGDKVTISNGIVSVNGQVLNENYVNNLRDITTEYDVPDGEYFFMGDNRQVSKDSTVWSNPYIDAKDILGKAEIKFYPFSDFGNLK